MSTDNSFEPVAGNPELTIVEVDRTLAPLFTEVSEYYQALMEGRKPEAGRAELEEQRRGLQLLVDAYDGELGRLKTEDALMAHFGMHTDEEDPESSHDTAGAAVIDFASRPHIVHMVSVGAAGIAEAVADIPAEDPNVDVAEPEPEPAVAVVVRPAHSNEELTGDELYNPLGLTPLEGEHKDSFTLRVIIANAPVGTVLRFGDFVRAGYGGRPLPGTPEYVAAAQRFRRYIAEPLERGDVIKSGSGAGTSYQVMPKGLVTNVDAQEIDEPLKSEPSGEDRAEAVKAEVADIPVVTAQAVNSFALSNLVEVVEPKVTVAEVLAPASTPEARTYTDKQVSLTTNGLGVQRRADGSLVVTLNEKPLDYLEELGDMPAHILLSLAMRVYNPSVGGAELPQLIAKLSGANPDAEALKLAMNRMTGRIIIAGQQSIKYSPKQKGWILYRSEVRDTEAIKDALLSLGFSKVTTHRFLV